MLLVPVQIAEVSDTETSEGDQKRQRERVLAGIGIELLVIRADQIGLAGAGQRLFDRSARGRNHLHDETADRYGIAGMQHCVRKLRADRHVRLNHRARLRMTGVGVVAVVVDVLDRHGGGKLGNAAGMIAMIVGNYQVVDLANARSFGRRGNPEGIAIVIARITGIDEHRFTAGRDVEGRLAALDVDSVNPKLSGERKAGQDEQESGSHRQKPSFRPNCNCRGESSFNA